MRVAALYDVHGMVDALEAALAEVPDDATILVGGDVAGGPQPAEVLDALRALGDRVVWIRGNADRGLAFGDEDAVSAGNEAILRWTSERLSDEQRAFLGSLPDRVTLDVDGLGRVLFVHASPRNDLDVVTEATPEEQMHRLLEGVEERIVVCGHTHMQLDRVVDGIRWVNAGSVGMPYEGEVAAFWTLLGPEVEFRRTRFDVERAVDAVLASGWPPAEKFVRDNMREAVRREDVVPLFEQIAIDRGER